MTDVEERRISCFRDRTQGRLYEQLADGTFGYLSSDGKTLHKVEYIEIGNVRYLPIDCKATRMGVIPLPTGVQGYGTVEKLVKEIDMHIKKYFDCSDDFRQFASLYIPMSWVADSLETISYLRFLGDYGTGKSRGFDTVGYLCYKPIMFGGSINPAPLFRLMDAWNGTLLLDECVLTDSTEQNNLVQVLNAGINKKGVVWRCSEEDNTPEPYNAYGPKIVGARHSFADTALESRFITEHMEETNRNLPIELPKEFYDEQRILRRKLLMFRFKNWNKIGLTELHAFQLPKVSRRLQQMVICFYITFVQWSKLCAGMSYYVERLHNRQMESGAATIDGGIVTAICDLHAAGFTQISSRDIRDQMKGYGYDVEGISDVSIGIRRKGLGIEARQMMINGKTKMSIVWDNALMAKLITRYIPLAIRDELERKFKMSHRPFPSAPKQGIEEDDMWSVAFKKQHQ